MTQPEPASLAAPSSGSTIGVDLGGTNVRAALVSGDGHILAEDREATPRGGSGPVVAAIVRLMHGIDPGAGESVALGVGAAGLVDRAGIVRFAPNIPGLVDAPLRDELCDVLDVPVFVDNDANAAAWGELCHGAARGIDDALVVTLGTGVGGGIIANGRVYRGAHGFAAEIGHWTFSADGPLCACGERGHWEASASGHALARFGQAAAAEGRAPGLLDRARGVAAAVTAPDVAESAAAGEPDGLAVLDTLARNIALGLAGLANILDPEVIVVSGGLVELGDLLLEPVREAFADGLEGAAHRPPVPIVPAELGDRAGVVGAAVLARECATRLP